MASRFNFDSNVIILDGGFGTTLEQVFHLDISNTPLWSTKAVVDHPDVVMQTHLAFLRAGADIISTSTYQSSYSTFEKEGYSGADARRIMSKSVELASQARQRFREEQLKNGGSPRHVRIALSLGPFGATLKPAQEFDGFYPPPFGPKAYFQHAEASENYNSFGDDEVAEAESIRALAQFHFERLLIMFEDKGIWDNIDCLAFETVPLTREIRAIRQAMGLLDNRVDAAQTAATGGTKPWWISMVFPGGIYPETAKDRLSRISILKIVSSATGDPSSKYPSPSALGINCTQVEYISELVSQLEEQLKTSSDYHSSSKPWLVLYPNGGDVYDPITQAWSEERSEKNEKQWAEVLTSAWTSSGTWGGVILGGCCRTTPKHIESLKGIADAKRSTAIL